MQGGHKCTGGHGDAGGMWVCRGTWGCRGDMGVGGFRGDVGEIGVQGGDGGAEGTWGVQGDTGMQGDRVVQRGHGGCGGTLGCRAHGDTVGTGAVGPQGYALRPGDMHGVPRDVHRGHGDVHAPVPAGHLCSGGGWEAAASTAGPGAGAEEKGAKPPRAAGIPTAECHNREEDVPGGPASPHTLGCGPGFKPHRPAPLLPASAPCAPIGFSPPLRTIPPGFAVPCFRHRCMYVLRMLFYRESGQY